MSELEFVWDPPKDELNRRKHKIAFEDAKHAFTAVLDESFNSTVKGEDRWQLIGFSETGIILIVIYTMEDYKIRFISARPLNPCERKKIARLFRQRR